MKHLIFQSYHGPLKPGTIAGIDNMKEYARRIGAAHMLDLDQRFTRDMVDAPAVPYFDRFRPVYDYVFSYCEKVAYVDCDVFATDRLKQSIFDHPVGDFALAPEPDQPAFRMASHSAIRTARDEIWASRVKRLWGWTMPRDEQGRLLVFNAGVILWSREGLQKCRTGFLPMGEYRRALRHVGDFYARDQNYIHAMAFSGRFNFTPLDVEWNRQLHGLHGGSTYDARTKDTKFVHVQLSGADHQDAAWHHRIVNSYDPR